MRTLSLTALTILTFVAGVHCGTTSPTQPALDPTKRDQACHPATTTQCGTRDRYCTSSGACAACAPGTGNCDGDDTNGCECAGECDGTTCVPTGKTNCSGGGTLKFCSRDTEICVYPVFVPGNVGECRPVGSCANDRTCECVKPTCPTDCITAFDNILTCI
jgi:hypothetical protein